MAELPAEVRELFERRNFAHLAIEGKRALEIIDRLSNQYTGVDFPMRSGVVHVIEPDRSGHVVLPFAH